jgi:ribosome-associated translation inhibitor RaiA
MKQTGKITHKPQMGLTFEDVWAMFQETARRQEETDRQIKETHKQIGELGNKFGAVVEHMMIPNLKEKFNALGYEFGKVSTNVLIETKEEGTIAEIDIFLENGDCAMAVEVKSQPTTEGIRNQCKRMERLRKYSDKRNDKRKLYGAVAGAIFNSYARNYALKQGLYLIEQSGDTVRIIEPSGENTAKAW